MTTAAEQRHLDAIHEMPCLLAHTGMCSPRVEAHHITSGGRRIGHFHTLPLCFNHHQRQSPLPFGEAIDKGAQTFARKYGTPAEMLAKVLRRCPCPTCTANRLKQGDQNA